MNEEKRLNRGTQEDIWSILISGERDPYMIQDKLKSKELFVSLDAIKTATEGYEQRESEKFAATREIKQGFNLIAKIASGGNKEWEDSLYHSLVYSFNHHLKQVSLANQGQINLDLKKEAADKAITSVLPKKAEGVDVKPILMGAAAGGIPALIYNLLKGDQQLLSFLPYSALGAMLGTAYQALPEDSQFLG